jgi:hypothetical protein
MGNFPPIFEAGRRKFAPADDNGASLDEGAGSPQARRPLRERQGEGWTGKFFTLDKCGAYTPFTV